MLMIYMQSFKLIAWKLWEELTTQIFQRCERRTDGQEQNIMPTDYRQGGGGAHKTLSAFEKIALCPKTLNISL